MTEGFYHLQAFLKSSFIPLSTKNFYYAQNPFKICHESLPEVNFTNVSRAAFTGADLISAKRQSSHQCLFVLLGSASLKAAHKTLVKSTPGGDLSVAKRSGCFYALQHLNAIVLQCICLL
jgi:hypothetical protein